MKKIYKNKDAGKITGVCAGVSEYLNVDVSIVRVAWAACALSGIGLVAYFLAAVIFPDKKEK